MTIVRSDWLRGGLAAGAATAVLLSSAYPATSAQAPRARGAPGAPGAMTLVDLAMIPRITDPQLSSDGRFVTYVLSKADWKADALVAHIFRQDVAGGPPVQLTHGDDERVERVSPDGRTIVYWAAKRAGTDLEKRGQLYVVPTAGGEAQRLTNHVPRVNQAATSATDIAVAWAPDGRSVYFLASDVPAPGRTRAGQLVTFEETDFEQQHLWKVDVATGAEQQVTRGDWSVISFRISRDGKHATLLRSPTPLTIDHYRSDIWVLDFETGALHEVTRNGVYETEADMSPDDSQVYFIADANNALDVYYGPSLFVVPLTGGAPRRVTPDATYTVEQAAWAPDGKSLLAVANMGAHNEIVRVDVATGATRALTNGDHQIPGWSFVPAAARMVFQFDEPTRLGDAWTLPVEGGTPTRVTGIYDSLARDFALPQQEKVSWKAADGVTIEGILYYPIGYQQGRRYPLVVQLHGGPVLSDKFGFGPGVILNYVPVLTGKGYAVFRPNFRGSAGYGPAFIRDIVNHYFNNMHLDVMAGVDALVQRGVADPDRLAVTGWSAGGTLVNKLITFTNRFKAASSGAGVANWISLMAQTDALTRRTFWFGGTPWDKGADLNTFMDQSPIKYVANARTPTLFFVGENDTRVGKAQSQEMYRGLEHNGVPTKLILAPDEGHDGAAWKLRRMLDKDNRELEWFEKYVMGRAYKFETPDN